MTCIVQFTIPYSSRVPSDVVTTTWHADFNSPPFLPGPAEAAALVQKINNFYKKIFEGSPGAMAQYMSPGNSRAKVYDLTDPMPRVALFDGPSPVVASEDLVPSYMPPETAVCLSYRAAYQSGLPKASQRGRIFLGGIGNACIDAAVGVDFPVVNAGFRNDIGVFANNLITDFADVDWTWVVYSRKLNQSFPVVGGWVDNALDTQRRRGVTATTRTNWP